MPELPDITVYIERLRLRIGGQILQKIQIVSPFLLRTFDPPLDVLHGRRINDLLRLGKRIVWCFDDELYLVLHLMIAGRLHWKPVGAKLPAKIGLAAFRFATGTLLLTEAGTKKRASLQTLADWTERLRQEVGDGFPEKVTAFREGMAVHGRFGQPCPVCGAAVQRIIYAENETNYCARCQTGGRLLADRSLSRLLKDDWPKSIDDL